MNVVNTIRPPSRDHENGGLESINPRNSYHIPTLNGDISYHNAIAYVLRSGCAWRLMPHDLPPWSTVYDYFRQWRIDGTWERINTALREKLRTTIGREAEPSAAIIDSQTVKTTEKGGHAAVRQARKSRDANAIAESTRWACS